MNKVKAAEDFLKSLENPQITMDIMVDRIDVQMLYVINNYSDLISKVRKKTNSLEEKDIVTCSMIIGYLLKSHLDRYELEQSLKINVLDYFPIQKLSKILFIISSETTSPVISPRAMRADFKSIEIKS